MVSGLLMQLPQSSGRGILARVEEASGELCRQPSTPNIRQRSCYNLALSLTDNSSSHRWAVLLNQDHAAALRRLDQREDVHAVDRAFAGRPVRDFPEALVSAAAKDPAQLPPLKGGQTSRPPPLVGATHLFALLVAVLDALEAEPFGVRVERLGGQDLGGVRHCACLDEMACERAKTGDEAAGERHGVVASAVWWRSCVIQYQMGP